MEVLKAQTDEIVRFAAEKFNERTSERHYLNEVRFSFYNHYPIMEALGYIWDSEKGWIRDPNNPNPRAIDLADIPKKHRKSVLIIGSGPTLDDALPRLKDWEGDIICSTSHAATLIYHGREPEHIVALDPDSHLDELAADRWDGRNSMLHIHPGVSPDLVRWWKGPIVLFRKLQPQTPFYGTEQAIGYGTLGPISEGRYQGQDAELLIKGQIPMLACIISAQICIAKVLGYHQQAFVGCDFSFPGNTIRFTAWAHDGNQWIERPPIPINNYSDFPGSKGDPLIETEWGVKSTPLQVFYSHQVVVAWRITEANVVNTSHLGLLRMFPYVSLTEVLLAGNKGVKGFTLPRIRIAAEEHLAKQNIYFLQVGKGLLPHEFKDPLHEIPRTAARLKATLEQQGKGDDLDIEANMKRIRRLFNKVAADAP